MCRHSANGKATSAGEIDFKKRSGEEYRGKEKEVSGDKYFQANYLLN